MLIVDRANFQVDGKSILHEVSLRFEPETLNVLVGPNGAGKSTLIAAIAGDLPSCRTSVRIDGKILQAWKPKSLAQQRSVLTQDHSVRFAFTTREVVGMGRLPYPPDPERDEAIIDDAMVRADITHLNERDVQTMSGGEVSRTAFARVLAQDTPLVLLDEPTAALDLYHQEQLLQDLWRLARKGSCVIAVLHDLNLSAAYADRIIMMSDGRVVADGSPRDVLTAETIQRVYRQQVLVMEHPTRRTPLIVSDSPIGW